MRKHADDLGLLILALWLVLAAACGSDDAEATAGGDVDLAAAIEAEGFDVAEGRNIPFAFPEDCAALPSCYSGNSTSPYAFFGVPPAPGAAPLSDVGGFETAEDGVAVAFQLRPDEVVIYTGRTSPRAAYFSYAPYLFGRHDNGTLVDLFASLGDALNQTNIAVGDADSPFGAEVAVIVTAHAGLAERAKGWLTDAGIDPDQQNLMVLPSDIARLGDEPGVSDVLLVLQRFALFDDPEEGQAYLDAPTARVLRITPEQPLEPDPIATPPRVMRTSGNSESHLSAALDELEQAIQQAHGSGGEVIELLSAQGVGLAIEPQRCIDNLTPCQGEVSDTTYSAGPRSFIIGQTPNRLAADSGDYFMIYGVNHEATGNAIYSNVVVQNANRQAGIAALTSREMAGSTDAYLPDHPDADQLFAAKVARDCAQQDHCIEVPTGFPGIDPDEDIMFLGRSYIKPGTSVAPAASDLLTERVLRFAAP